MKVLRMRMYLGLLAVVNANQVDLLDLLLNGEVHVFGQELMEKEMFSMRVYI
jgi:hypothetical protein